MGCIGVGAPGPNTSSSTAAGPNAPATLDCNNLGAIVYGGLVGQEAAEPGTPLYGITVPGTSGEWAQFDTGAEPETIASGQAIYNSTVAGFASAYADGVPNVPDQYMLKCSCTLHHLDGKFVEFIFNYDRASGYGISMLLESNRTFTLSLFGGDTLTTVSDALPRSTGPAIGQDNHVVLCIQCRRSTGYIKVIIDSIGNGNSPEHLPIGAVLYEGNVNTIPGGHSMAFRVSDVDGQAEQSNHHIDVFTYYEPTP